MNMNPEKMRAWGLLALRIGLGLVMIWFGTQQLLDAASWVGYLPSWISVLPISPIAFIHINSVFEILFGLLLIAGFYTRIVAFLLALHLFGIIATLGYNEIGVRDFGLAFSLLAAALLGAGEYSLDHHL